MQVKFIFDGGRSTRFHTQQVLKVQNIAEHSFGVAWLCEFLTDGTASKQLIMAALAHDLAEHIVGDIPSPTKRDIFGLSKAMHEYEEKHLYTAGLTYTRDLTETEAFVLNIADMVEGMIYCLYEKNLGNRTLEIVFFRFKHYTESLLTTRSEVVAGYINERLLRELLEDLTTEMEK